MLVRIVLAFGFASLVMPFVKRTGKAYYDYEHKYTH